MTVVIAHVQPGEASEAYQWHRGFAASNNHLFPRSRAHYETLTENYQVVAARERGEFVGLCYYAQDGESDEWELGGLMVGTNQRGRGLGATLMYVTLGILLVDVNPLEVDEWIISHVIKGNDAPRSIIADRLKFKIRRQVKIPAEVLPGLMTQEDGMVHGDEFELTIPATLNALADWCDAWTGTLRDGTPAHIELREGMTPAAFAEASRELATILSS
ncbi:GNAT family N-acetyltransferase [Rhodococcus ruber]|uniref:GNAT family N-acetyltransferase n=1 Tax=Rhodococcus ruber TaxID=1830 RepID=UPI00167ED32B|nr:GNAT family N-acetyltransferase [Rhodococcus ruber]